ncbi:hypothetical protein JTE90_000229 [Oedothorax gibbosus]|uniref:SWIM-type domain-containing protein n=1 Tax=Oedothorax gibbosus TaxID=931172 RepID=A0AAV6VC86_9ARAC|nr:hypothetical protein JTE90_000229 [Oedothorax gibbosus]
MFDWDEGDRFSFEDSDRFEEDSLCSWISEPESSCNNWRGWKRQSSNYHLPHASNKNKDAPSGSNSVHRTSEDFNSSIPNPSLAQASQSASDGQVTSLVELSAKIVAFHIPFEVVEHVCPPVPEQLQLRIAFWSFPENEEDIRLYSCLANGSADEFQRGEHLYKARAVKELLQIGFHLSATITPPPSISVSKGSCNVAVTFDRCRITSCTCTCTSSASWCSHVVAVCLSRIHQPNHVRLRAPVSESLSRLHRVQLQKFAQYLISELPQQILPTAQRLLDELLSSQQTAINTLGGAPDPTAGASINEQTTWCLDGSTLHDNIRKILIKLCVPSPIVFSDVNYLSSTAPPAAAEWSSLLRPLRGREPEGLWNLLSIVREMFHRSDRNAIPLLEILTEEVLQCDQILSWWFSTKVSLHMGSGGHGGRGSMHSNTHASQHACSSLCDEVVILWRLAGLNPALSPQDRQTLFGQLRLWHMKTLERVWKTRSSSTSSSNNTNTIKRADIEVFPGFRPAMEGCLLDWSDYPIPGVTYAEGGGRRWYCPYVHVRSSEPSPALPTTGSDSEHNLACFSARRGRSVDVGQITGLCPCDKGSDKKSICVLNFHHSAESSDHKLGSNRSSLSSEGFCENDQEVLQDALACLRPLNQPEGLSSSKLVLVNSSEWNSQESLQEDSDGAKGGPPSKSWLQPSTSKAAPLVSTSEKEKLSGDSKNPESVLGAAAQHSAPRASTSRQPTDASGEASESQQSSDEYHLYYYDPRARLPSPEHPQPYVEEQWHSVAVKKIEDSLEVLFARAEALHAHGHSHEACMLAIRLAEELLASPPNLTVEVPPATCRGKKVRRFNPASHHVSLLASATLAKVAFLCSVLGENQEHHHLAFRVGLFGLEMTRPPASTKALEVKLANQEQDLVLLLKRLPLLDREMSIIRERAEQLRDGKLVSRGEALLPLMLASFIFDALTLSNSQNRGNPPTFKQPGDEFLGFEAAVAALGLKANVSEAEHPLLCEGTRRQRGDLAITLLVTYKDDTEKLAKIMEKLLDKEVHQMYKAPASSVYYSSASSPQQSNGSPAASSEDKGAQDDGANKDGDDGEQHDDGSNATADARRDGDRPANVNRPRSLQSSSQNSGPGSSRMRDMRQSHRMHEDNGEHSEGASSPGWEEDYKAWEAKFRCTNFRTTKKHSGGMASIDSSAPETTSSDNSPTVVRRSTWLKQCGPGSDSGSSGESSDSFASSSSEEKPPRSKSREGESLPVMIINNRLPTTYIQKQVALQNPILKIKELYFLYDTYGSAYPSVPTNQRSSAHFSLSLPKLLTKRWIASSAITSFTSQNTGTPQALLCVHSRLACEAMEIGSMAINFLIETWEGHLTPPEVASLADRASRGRDPRIVRAAAELALSCLPHAHALNPNEIQRALIQCKEQSSEMLERACLAVESAAKGGGVYPEVLFDVARRWHELYEESLDENHHTPPERHLNTNPMENLPNLSTPPPCDHNMAHSIHLGQVESVITTVPSMQVLPPMTVPPVSYTLAYPTAAYGYMPFSHSHVPIHPAYVSSATTYPYPPLPNLTYYPPAMASVRHPATMYPGQMVGTAVTRASVTQSSPVLSMNGHAVVTQPPPQSIPPPQQTPIHGPLPQLNQRQMGYLLAAYRVGMLAMETLARRVHDDRPQAKYARNPPYGEDVKWLLGIAKKLGTSYLQDFCICTVNSVASPFVLHEIVVEAAQYLARSSTAPLPQPLRSHLLTPLIQKCQQMFTACTHFKMYHITPAEYDEFVSIIRSARTAFQLTPGGIVQFNELLQSLRRTKSCKKDLWQRIANTLATPTI